MNKCLCSVWVGVGMHKLDDFVSRFPKKYDVSRPPWVKLHLTILPYAPLFDCFFNEKVGCQKMANFHRHLGLVKPKLKLEVGHRVQVLDPIHKKLTTFFLQ